MYYMFKRANKYEVVPAIFVFLWIFLLNVVSIAFLQGIDAWPMYFVTIFFFVMGGDKKNIPSIFGGALTGIVFTWLMCRFLVSFMPELGQFYCLVIALFVILGLIIIGGSFCPVLLNNITFAYLTITTIVFDVEVIFSKTVPWIIMLFVGGAIILIGALLILNSVSKLMQNVKKIQN